MKKLRFVSIKPFYGKVFLKNKLFKVNNGHNIFFALYEKLKRRGVVVYTHDMKMHQKADYFVYCDVPYPWNLKDWLRIFSHIEKNILFCFESPLINPFNHFKLFHFPFRRVYTWNGRLLINSKYSKLHIPQLDENSNLPLKKFSSKKFLVMVNAKKSAPWIFKFISPNKKDLYKERLKALDYFERTMPHDFSLYGKGWNKPNVFSIRERIFDFKKYKTYKGSIKGDNKVKVISNFKFCISFENAQAEGYITEKIFDCFKGGCVPIYYGSVNIERYIPKETFIDFRDFRDYDELLNFLKSINEKKYNGYIISGKKFLKSKITKRTWFEKGFLKLFISAIN